MAKHRIWPLLALAFLIAGCGAAPLPLAGEPFHHPAGGISFRYPRGWQHLYLERAGGQVFYQSDQPIDEIMALRAMAEVPIVLVIAGPLAAVPHLDPDGIEDAKTALAAFLAWLDDVEGGKVGRARTVAVAGQRAAAADIRWPFLRDRDQTIAGRAVALYLGDRVFFIEAAGREEAWQAFKPTFEAMLESVTLE